MSKYVVIVPAKCPGKSLHLQGGSTGPGTKIVLGDQLPLWHQNFRNNLWIFDGTVFRSVKNGTKCIHLCEGQTSNGTKIQLMDYQRVGSASRANMEWVVR